MRFIPFLGAFVLGCAVWCSPCRADSLKEVLDSPEMQKLERASGSNQALDANRRWLDDESNFAGIFTLGARGRQTLLEWSGDLSTLADKGFKILGDEGSQTTEYAVAERKISAPGETEPITLTILVPHPKYLSLVDMRLLPIFSDLEPPSLAIDSVETMRFSTVEARLFHHRNGGCSILFKLPKGALLNLKSTRCGEDNALTRIAGQLTIDRLKQKLSS